MKKTPFKQITLLSLALAVVLIMVACQDNGEGVNISIAEPTVTPIPEQPAILQKPTYTVDRGSIVQIAEMTGRVGSLSNETISFGTQGRVSELYFREGDMVEEGDLIAVFDQLEDLKRETTLREISLRRAEISVERAQLFLDLTLENRWATEEDIQLKEWDLELAQLSYQELMLSLGEQLESVEAAQLIAPMDGMITKSSVRVNQIYDETDEVMTISDMNQLSVLVDTYTVDFESLQEGMQVELVAFGRPEVYEGTIIQMPYPFGTGPARDVDKYIYIKFDELTESEGWRISDRFTITVEISRAEDVLILPVEAIREFSGRTFVMLQEGDRQVSVDVTTGLTDGIMTEIVEGLEEGQIVIGQ
ncbi:MAG: efflux RND transporter periplasmic adaptor subunit [Anaerolineae bacterium]|jgi:RND family efflux transporter MFP subunit|nr:efflux RND transporter periplasmic adaptor subunit [Anaerolineae bacterium]